MLLNILLFLILGYNAIIVSGDCPKSREWRNMRISSSGPLVCARLYGDEKCSGFPLLFGINSSSSDLGTESSSAIEFARNNVTALVRPGCTMFLWEGANFTGRLEKSIDNTWNVDHRHFSSALCNCSVDDVELLQCELNEKWVTLNFCDFRESDFGGLCSVSLKHSYIADGDANPRSVTITKKLASLFAAKMFESFGEKRMATFLDVNSNDKLAHSVWVEAETGIRIQQRHYVCGKYRLFTPEVIKQSEHKVKNGFVPDVWIFNHISGTYFWVSGEEKKSTFLEAKDKCSQMGGKLADFDRAELRNWIKPLLASDTYHWWINEKREGLCTMLEYYRALSDIIKVYVWKHSNACTFKFRYICEKEHNV